MLFGSAVFSQNETKRWHFGVNAALNFNTTPPTVVVTSAMNAAYSCASVADASGNLLFYTNGNIIWDQTNSIMANGTGLNGNSGAGNSQGVIILKKPASTGIYYVFTTQWNTSTGNGLYYSEVDMSLAAGNGSVTVKNVPIVSAATTNTSTSTAIGKLTATRHCNGTDIWLVARDANWNNIISTSTTVASNSFRSFLISPAGVNITPVVSSPSSYVYNANASFYYYDYGNMKISATGKKLGVAMYSYGNLNLTTNSNQSFELYDFDNTTGVVTNSLALSLGTTTNYINNYAWGCEFSPDGTKFYGSRLNSGVYGGVFQWDLCAGTPSAVAASMFVVAGTTINNFGSMQVATDGKVYIARSGSNLALDVINNPNAAGAACNYVSNGQSTSPKYTNYSLPNFMGSSFLQHPTPVPFTSTVSNAFGCQTASFNSVYNPVTNPLIGCASAGYSLTGIEWDFGDPGTGAANTSSLSNPSHYYPVLGTYTTQLILHYSCGGGTDTIRQPVNVTQPCISVSPTSITCNHLGSATVTAFGGGPYSYTWMPTGQTSSVATNLSPGYYVITVNDVGNNFTYTASVNFVSSIPLTGNLASSSSITCYGAATGSANVTNIAGGSGGQHYSWSNGVVTFTNAFPQTLTAGAWNVSVADTLTGCTINDSFIITQPPATTITLVASSPTACAGGSIALTGTASGGTPGFTYTFTAGPVSTSYTVSHSTAGSYVYTLGTTDANSCVVSNTIGVAFINNPTLTVSSVSICPLQTGTLLVSGATNYTWNTGAGGSTFTDNPLSGNTYTVTGEALSCTAVATASISLKPVPVPVLGSNSPVCNGQQLNFSASGGSNYLWSGPQSFNAAVQNPVLSNAAPNNSGTYQATVTAANSCTASAAINVTVNPTPTLTLSGSTVCVTQTLNVYASSFASATYAWVGPNGFVSLLQNPFIVHPPAAATGNYSVTVTSVAGCTNTAVTSASVVTLPLPFYTSNSPQCTGSSLVFNSSGTANGPVLYSWSGPNGFISSAQHPTIASVAVPASGTYTLTVTKGPCVASYASPVVINALPGLIAGTTGPACVGGSVQVFASGSGTAYAWSGPSGFSSQQPTLTVFNPASFSNAGTYVVTTTDIHGCQSSASASVTMLSNPVISAKGSTVCLNQTSTLNVSGASTYVWQGPSGYVSYSSPAIVPVTNAAATGMYVVIGTAVNGCTHTAAVQINIQPLPQPSLIVTPTACVNMPITLQGFGGYTYVWTGPQNFMATSETVSFTAFSGASGGTYVLTVADSIGCKNYTSTVIAVHDLPRGSLWSSQNNHCIPFYSEFKLLPVSASAPPVVATAWELNGKSFSQQQPGYYFDTEGAYLLKGTLSDAYCTSTTVYTINAYGLPVADFSILPENPVENTDPVILTNTSRGSDLKLFNWSVGDGSTTTSATEHMTHLFSDAGTYPIVMVATSAYGCSDTVVKLVTVVPDVNVYVPNTFTPNDDGKNDVFIPVSRNITTFSFSIYNRWGEKLYTTQDPAKGWDGTYNGQPCQQDVYVWKLAAWGKNGVEKKLTGFVNLYR